jgi:hypothetical protein
MTDTATVAPAAAPVLTPANILEPASVPVPEKLNNPAQPPAEAAKEPPKEATPGDEAAAPEKPEDPKRKSARERIHELTAQKYEAQRRADEAISEARRLREQLQKRPEIDPNDYDAQQDERLRRVVKSERFDETVAEARSAQEAAAEARSTVFMAKVEAARERIPDLDAALGDFSKLPVTQDTAELIAESEKAAEIAYYLAKNPDQAIRIANLPPVKQGAALKDIEHKISAGTPRRTTNAPPPPPMIGASSSPATPSLRDMGVAEIGALLGYAK